MSSHVAFFTPNTFAEYKSYNCSIKRDNDFCIAGYNVSKVIKEGSIFHLILKNNDSYYLVGYTVAKSTRYEPPQSAPRLYSAIEGRKHSLDQWHIDTTEPTIFHDDDWFCLDEYQNQSFNLCIRNSGKLVPWSKHCLLVAKACNDYIESMLTKNSEIPLSDSESTFEDVAPNSMIVRTILLGNYSNDHKRFLLDRLCNLYNR